MDPIGALVLTLTLAFSSWLTWWVVHEGGSGSIGPNQLMGIRTRATKASPAAWAVAHEAALPWVRRTGLVAVGVSAVGTAVLAAGGRPATTVVGTVLALSGYAVLVVGLVLAATVADRAARGSLPGR